jgi:UDP-N-acetylglucosamine 2-epimerase (non-hydrolysing)
MPEEINRILTDCISDLLFCTEQSGVENLIKEGIPKEKIFLVGNVMIDTLMTNKAKADESNILEKLNLKGDDFAVLTLHRPSNVDNPTVFGRILDALEIIQNDMPVIFPIHPRTLRNLKSFNFENRFKQLPNLQLIEPLGYLDFLKIMSCAKLVLTDSGGIQEETTILKVPCLTLRENTERPVTVESGLNQIVGTNPETIVKAYNEVMKSNIEESHIPPLWDGRAAQRIAAIIIRSVKSTRADLFQVSSIPQESPIERDQPHYDCSVFP